MKQSVNTEVWNSNTNNNCDGDNQCSQCILFPIFSTVLELLLLLLVVERIIKEPFFTDINDNKQLQRIQCNDSNNQTVNKHNTTQHKSIKFHLKCHYCIVKNNTHKNRPDCDGRDEFTPHWRRR